MYSRQEIKDSLVFDIETAANYPSFSALEKANPKLAELWLKKHDKLLEQEIKRNGTEFENLDQEYDYIYVKYASLYPEFSKPIVISFGVFEEQPDLSFKIKVASVSSDNEKDILQETGEFLKQYKSVTLAGFNIKGFDIPYLFKKFLINQINVPEILQIRGKKPWELKMIDVMEDWKSTGWENSSLDLVASVMGIDSPKDKINNDEVSLFYNNKKVSLKEIEEYCEKDVTATMKVMLKVSNYKF